MNIVFEIKPALADVMPVTHYVQESSSPEVSASTEVCGRRDRKRIIPTPTRNRTNAKNQLSAKTARYRNQISTLLGVPPLKFPPIASALWECRQIFARMSGMLDLSSTVNPKHFLPRSLSDAPIR